MRKNEVLKLVIQHKPGLIRRFGISDLALFGSAARDEARESNDIDVLVGMQVPHHDKKALKTFLDTLGYRYWDKSVNPTYKLFLE